jgi:branched-chain amino acid transport system ATP-binding protein
LVNVLTGLTPPSTGTVSFKGHDVGRTGALRLLRLGMARSFQLVNIFPLLTVRETIAVAAISNLGQGGRIFAGLRANKSVWDIVERVADLFGFASKLEQPAKSLSQGDKKLLDVASAFALRPEIILLDEPTSGVSTAEKATIMRVLVEAAKHTGIKAIIQVEHDMDIVFGYSTRIIAVHNGRILADGTPEAIRAQSDVMTTVVGRL